MKNKLVCECGNDTFKIGFEMNPDFVVAVDQIDSIICAKCGKEYE